MLKKILFIIAFLLSVTSQISSADISDGITYLKQLKFQEAYAFFDSLIKQGTTTAPVYYYRGLASYNLKRYKLAIDDFSHSIEIDSSFSKAYSDRGAAYFNQRKYDLAKKDYYRAIKSSPRDADSYYRIGHLFKNGYGNTDSAMFYYTTAIQLDSTHTYAFLNRGNLNFDSKNYQHAIADYTTALRLKPDLQQARYSLGISYYFSGQYDSALSVLQLFLDKTPNNYLALYYQAVTFEQLRKLPEAKNAFKQLLPLVPTTQTALIEDIQKRLNRLK